MLEISALRVENRDILENSREVCITDRERPVFSFAVKSSHTGVVIKSARIWVNGWECDAREQTGIVYGGGPLSPLTEYIVKLSVTDNYGERDEKEATFETGLMGGFRKGQWISDPSYRFTGKKVSPTPLTFQRSFSLDGEVARARIFSTAMGIYELELNGKKVGKDYFAPGFTSYRHQLQYQIYDVTRELQENNTLLAVVGGGWAVGSYTYKRMNRLAADRPAFLCEVEVEYADGRCVVLGTDESWDVTREGRFKACEFYDGEVFDATVDYGNIPWSKAGREKLRFIPHLIAQVGDPVRAREVLRPAFLGVSPGGVLIYDMGQNFAGVIRARLWGHRGQVVVFSHAEILMDGELYTQPLRSAKQQAVYTCVEGEQTYSPRMTYMGFRYVGVTGIEADQLELEGVAVYSDIPPSGSFSCSHEMLNRMQSCIQWGERSNMVDIPTDCPQRDERLGWTGDIALFSPTAAWNFDTSRFFDKWLSDVSYEQGHGGGIPMIVPQVRIKGQFEMLHPLAVDHWGDACILVPWAEYRARGDKELLRRMYGVMKKYIKACLFWAGLFSIGGHRRIWKLLFHYGDWCAPDAGYRIWVQRGKWTATACLAHSCGIMGHIAGIIGEEKDEKYYARLAKETAEAYRCILMDSDCRISEEFQTGYVLPLYYGLLSKEDAKKAAEHLARLVRANDHHIGTGFPGTPYVLFALADHGYAEDAFQMLLNESCPSWLYEIKAGGTTFWERWDALREDGTVNLGEDNGSGGMVSFNHYACGAVGDFLYRRVLGMEPLEGGYRRFMVKPLVGGGLTWAEGSVLTPYGEAASRWNLENGVFSLTVKVPANTSCEVVLPSGRQETVGSGEWTFRDK